MFLESFKITHTSPCLADENQIKIKAAPSVGIAEILPYLNTVLKRPFYAPEKKVLQMRKDTKIILLGDNEVSMTKLQNITDAYYELDLLKNIINETYERRGEITPIYETRKLPGVIEIYKLLPKTNCKKCGEPSCMALATKLSNYQVDENQCPELLLENYAELKVKLTKLLTGE